MPAPLLVYGAYGYTGELIARRAVARGLPVVLAGRDAARLATLGAALGCPWRAFPLSEPGPLRRGLEGVGLVLHCAGPFFRTFRPMVEACLDLRIHYLDITGEIPVFQQIAALGSQAERAGVMLLPGSGFDVVPTDCLAAHVARRRPGAARLALGFQSRGGISIGTARTMTSLGPDAPPPGPGPRRRRIDYGRGLRRSWSIPWGDVFTARRATGIEDVTVYLAMPLAQALAMGALQVVAPLFRLPALAEGAARLLAGGVGGPDARARAAGSTVVWAEAVDPSGQRAVARLSGPEGYQFTALAAVEIAERVLRGEVKPGWQTPASAYGPDLALAVPGVERVDVE
jgi:short subunit dehydrogenase-like uncharacterized protein